MVFINVASAKKPATEAKKVSKLATEMATLAESKGAKILELIGRPKGATLAEIMNPLTGRRTASAGSCPSAGKKRGLNIESTKNDAGERVYQIKKSTTSGSGVLEPLPVRWRLFHCPHRAQSNQRIAESAQVRLGTKHEITSSYVASNLRSIFCRHRGQRSIECAIPESHGNLERRCIPIRSFPSPGLEPGS